jgi:hypothetical protein
VGWLARHPNDHFLRQAMPGISDHECRVLISAQIDRLAGSYEQLCGLDWSDQEAAVDTAVEVVILDAHAGSWTRPASARVCGWIKGTPVVGQELGVRLVEGVAAPFNGTRMGLLNGEHWRICATPVSDGTLFPLDGTRRLTAA